MVTSKKQTSRHLSLKLFSLLLAILLELFFYSPDNAVNRVMEVPVDVHNLPGSKIIVSPFMGEHGLYTDVEFRGPRQLIESLKESPPRFSLDLPFPVPDEYSFHLDARSLKVRSGVEVRNIDPRIFTIRIDDVIKKEFPIEVKIIGEPPSGYRLRSVKPYPAIILLQGPKSELERESTILTSAVDISEIRGKRVLDVTLQKLGTYTDFSTEVVSVEVEVVPIQSEKEFDKVPVKVRAPDGFAATVQPSNVEAFFSGSASALNVLTADSFELEVDASVLSEGRHEVPILSKVPPGVALERTVPAKVVLIVRSKDG